DEEERSAAGPLTDDDEPIAAGRRTHVDDAGCALGELFDVVRRKRLRLADGEAQLLLRGLVVGGRALTALLLPWRAALRERRRRSGQQRNGEQGGRKDPHRAPYLISTGPLPPVLRLPVNCLRAAVSWRALLLMSVMPSVTRMSFGFRSATVRRPF